MNKSAIMFALILNAFQATANAEAIVVAEGDEYASESEVVVAEQAAFGPVQKPAEGQDAGESSSEGVEDAAEFQRLFGGMSSGEGLSKADQKTIDAVATAALPWWSIPVGLLAIGVLLIVRGRALKTDLPMEAIHVVSRQHMGKDGTLALIEVNDGDQRKRRLLVGLGGGAPRLVADVSAWEVAVAAPSNIANDAVAVVGPDPVEAQPVSAGVDERRASLHVAPATFETQLSQAAARYGAADSDNTSTGDEGRSKAELIEDVLAKRDLVRLETVGGEGGERIGRGARKPSYSSREVLV